MPPRTHPLSLLSFGLLATVGFSASALPSQPLVPLQSALPERCGTAPRSVEQSLALLDLLESLGDYPKAEAQGAISIAFHVIHRTDGTGDLSDAMIQDQVDVLTAAYTEHGFTFYTGSIDRTANNAWYNDFLGHELEIYQALAIDPAHNLNLYLSDIPYLGFAYLPGSFSESDVRNAVVILNTTLPGGSEYPYDEGDTATHEVGHYLGLGHTFDNGCVYPGDLVDDTPYESSPAWGCPVGRNTCSQSGVDPIHNFMDYTDDSCMYEFTPGQATRMHQQVDLYRPSLLDGACDLVLGLSGYPGAVNRGEVLSFDAVASNDCSGALTLDRAEITASGPTNWQDTLYDGAPISVSAGGQFSYTLNIAVPPTAPTGSYTVEVTIFRGASTLSSDSFPVDVN